MNNKPNKRVKISPKSLILIFLVLAALILTYSIIELSQSKRELTQLMEEQAHSLVESALSASVASLLSYEIVDREMKSRLLNNANFIKVLLEKKQITNSLLKEIAKTNSINRINIFNNRGKKTFTNYTPIHEELVENFSPSEFLKPIFNDVADTLFLGVREARYEDGYRFAVAIASNQRDAIVVNLDAKELLEYRKNIGFGALLRNLTTNKGITYAALQDTFSIIAASGKTEFLGEIANDQFLTLALSDSNIHSRIIENDSSSIFEVVHSLNYNDQIVGLLRLGLPNDPLNQITDQNMLRIIIMGLVLFALGAILISYIFTKQNFDTLKKDYKVIEDYSQNVIQNVSDSVIVVDTNLIVTTFNKAAETLTGKTQNKVIGESLGSLFDKELFELTNSDDNTIKPLEVNSDEGKKILLISKTTFEIEENITNTVFVIRDITKQKVLEEQMNRKERLVAMGELASGVAHEIRNPLNTISTIAQQLSKDFEPKDNQEEFYSLTKLVNKEVNRINNTVKDFLRFAKPEKITPNKFLLSSLFNQLVIQYKSLLDEKSIKLTTDINWDGEVNWDFNQILQTLMNLIQNSYDSISKDGQITLSLTKNNNSIMIKIIDTGSGIPQHIFKNIFNIYYTTKANGTGIGLSIVQRIIYEHNGTVEFDSDKNGTTFTLNLPINPF